MAIGIKYKIVGETGTRIIECGKLNIKDGVKVIINGATLLDTNDIDISVIEIHNLDLIQDLKGLWN